MCGITGIYSFKADNSILDRNAVSNSLQKMHHRGPDAQSIFEANNCILGHVRLSIIDTSSGANQPFTDASQRYTIIFNGEFYNYQSYYTELKNDGYTFRTTSDTEVLLYLYIKYKSECLNMINGFFSFAVFDNVENSLFIARDRMGIKPLYLYQNDSFIAFSSELHALLEYPIKREINNTSLYTYLQLQYIPTPNTILRGVTKITPGTYVTISNNTVETKTYYSIPYNPNNLSNISYDEAQSKLRDILDEAVKVRLVSDVPLGSFLSGGIDSSIVSSIASKYVPKLKTYSIGFTDNPYFDETKYAELVAKHINSDHTTIPISNAVFSDNVLDVLDSFDEPFADSSAIAVYILSKYVKQHVTVALSGDGADEIFAGYNKHAAHLKLSQSSLANRILKHANPLLSILPQSRSNSITNLFRKVNRYAQALSLSPSDCYWQLCSLQNAKEAKKCVSAEFSEKEFKELQSIYLHHFSNQTSVNDVLFADQKLVLGNDMLTKVDRMSMQHSIEVRSPFLDYNLLSFANSLPQEYKINNNLKKRILQDSYRSILPEELYKRPKQGFEVPLHSWCTTILQDSIQKYLSQSFIEDQNIFNYVQINTIKQRLHSHNPGDAASQIWAILVFQKWWIKYMS